MPRYMDTSNDRKLRPIFDHLDNGYNRKALQEVEKLLKKNKDSQYLRVLKAVTLTRMGKKKEATELLSEVHQECPNEDSVLQTMSMCYRELQRNDLIVSAYENALKKDPNDEKLFIHLFMAYARTRDYKKQQMTALNLHRFHPKSPYYFWAVMSIYMQAISSDDESIVFKIILPLAEKMCEKFYKENKFENGSEYDLYLMILEKQKKYSLMIEIMDAAYNKKFHDNFNFIYHKRAELLRKDNRLKEAFEAFKILIKSNNDQYNYYLEAFEIANLLDNGDNDEKIEQSNGGDSNNCYVLQLLDLVNEMCSLGKTTIWKFDYIINTEDSDTLPKNIYKRCPRGPFMARIVIYNELKKRKQINNSTVEKYLSESEINDLMLDYFNRFGSKFVCVKDMKFMFKKINDEYTVEQIEDLINRLKLSLLNINEKDIVRKLHFHYLEYYHKPKLVRDDCIKESMIIWNLYEKAEHNDQQPFDPFIYHFVTNLLADLDIYQGNDPMLNSRLFDAIVFLECYQSINKTDFYTKLMLICLYNSVGAALSSQALYESLEIKLIQNDTLGYYFLPAYLHCGLYQNAEQFLKISWKFYTFNFKEVSDYIISGYKNCSFTKIEEIINFNRKLQNSIQCHYSFIEKFHMELMTECKNDSQLFTFVQDGINHILDDKLVVDWKIICDNRDTRLLSSNHKQIESYIDDCLVKETSLQDVVLLKFRFVLLKALILGAYLSNKFIPDENEESETLPDSEILTVEKFEEQIKELNELAGVAETNIEKKLNYYLQGPAPSRLNTYFSGKYPHLILALFDDLLNLLKIATNQVNEDNSKDHTDLLQNIAKELESLNTLKADVTLKGFYNLFGTLSVVVDILNICSILYVLLENNMRKLSKSSKKSSKKKKNNSQNFKGLELFLQKFTNSLAVIQTNIDGYFKTITAVLDDGSEMVKNVLENLEYRLPAKFENFETGIERAKNNIKASYLKSFSEMSTIIQAKQKYLLSRETTKN